MRNECNIIRDILPLYAENMVSADTSAFVDEHLEKCPKCQVELNKLKSPSVFDPISTDIQINDAAPIKTIKKKWVKRNRLMISITALITALVVLFIVFLSAGRAGGEIGFEATINKVEDGIAFATVTEQDAGFLSKKLPKSITFDTADLDEELQAGDKISACYMSGTIDGHTVRVVSVSIMTD